MPRRNKPSPPVESDEPDEEASDSELSSGSDVHWTGFKRNVYYLHTKMPPPGRPTSYPSAPSKLARVVDLSKGNSFSDPLEIQDGPDIGTIEKPIELDDSDDEPQVVSKAIGKGKGKESASRRGKEKGKERSSVGESSRSVHGITALASPPTSTSARRKRVREEVNTGSSSKASKRPYHAPRVTKRMAVDEDYEDEDVVMQDDPADSRRYGDTASPSLHNVFRGHASSSLLTPPRSLEPQSPTSESLPLSPELASSDDDLWYHLPGFEPLPPRFSDDGDYTVQDKLIKAAAPEPTHNPKPMTAKTTQVPRKMLNKLAKLVIESGTGSRRARLAFAAENANFTLVERFNTMKASGVINSIAQSKYGVIAVASSAVNGHLSRADISRQDFHPDPYNHSGNVLVWNPRYRPPPPDEEEVKMDAEDKQIAKMWGESVEVDGSQEYAAFVHLPDGHSVETRGKKHYSTVLEVAFDPLNPDRFLTSGADGTVARWELKPHDDRIHAEYEPLLFPYPRRAHAISYHPKHPVFAVGCFNGVVYIESPDRDTKFYASRLKQPVVGPSGDDRQICSMTWGHGSRTHHHMFFSVESPTNDRGEVYAWNWRKNDQPPERWFPEVRGGGALLALDSLGRHIAIAASSPDNDSTHALYLYGTVAFGARLVDQAGLPEVAKKARHIMDLQWSPNDICVAIARDDNTALIYDIRSLNQPLHELFEMPKPPFGQHRRQWPKRSYGIPNLGWVSSDVLITGGSDGYLRRWALNGSTEDVGGDPTAELNAPVAAISFGTKDGEHHPAIVAGDMDGRVYVYDFMRGLA